MIKVENKNKCKSRKHTHMWFNYLGSEYMYYNISNPTQMDILIGQNELI